MKESKKITSKDAIKRIEKKLIQAADDLYTTYQNESEIRQQIIENERSFQESNDIKKHQYEKNVKDKFQSRSVMLEAYNVQLKEAMNSNDRELMQKILLKINEL